MKTVIIMAAALSWAAFTNAFMFGQIRGEQRAAERVAPELQQLRHERDVHDRDFLSAMALARSVQPQQRKHGDVR